MSKIVELFKDCPAACEDNAPFSARVENRIAFYAEVRRMEAELAECRAKLAAAEVELFGLKSEVINKSDYAARMWQANEDLKAKLAALEAQEPIATVLALAGRFAFQWGQYTPQDGDKLYLAAGAREPAPIAFKNCSYSACGCEKGQCKADDWNDAVTLITGAKVVARETQPMTDEQQRSMLAQLGPPSCGCADGEIDMTDKSRGAFEAWWATTEKEPSYQETFEAGRKQAIKECIAAAEDERLSEAHENKIHSTGRIYNNGIKDAVTAMKGLL